MGADILQRNSLEVTDDPREACFWESDYSRNQTEVGWEVESEETDCVIEVEQ